jgi:hypothetical protein
MRHMRRAKAILLLLLIWSASASAGPKIQSFLDSEVKFGCGCNFQFSVPNTRGKTFLWWLEGEDAFMRIDGKLEKLTVEQTEGRSKTSSQISVGDTADYTLSNKALQVKVSSVVVQACTPKNVECESVGVKARIKATATSGTTDVNAMGACGC